jgi:glycosyltransferase involved in cell wall biosynthesis
MKTLRILGTRGIPANHGGFETFAQHLALYLVQRGWQVTVYCQEDQGDATYEDHWCGVRLVHIPVKQAGVLGTIVFDWLSTVHAGRKSGLVLTLGYNTALFCLWYRLKGLTNLINMDGIEWRRQKWGWAAKVWFYFNEWAGAWLGNHLVADHPAIESHLSSRVQNGKITTIAYGAPRIDDADADILARRGLAANDYVVLIARAEPENSILEVVRAWSRKPRGLKLVVLGKYAPGHAYQAAVQQCASDEVLFLGAIYDSNVVAALRYFARFYIHGHQVGGTNPSLVEALGAGNAVLAHDNRFNRWVAGAGAQYFAGEQGCADLLDTVLHDPQQLAVLRQASRARHADAFTWERILHEYEQLLLAHLPLPTPLPALPADGPNVREASEILHDLRLSIEQRVVNAEGLDLHEASEVLQSVRLAIDKLVVDASAMPTPPRTASQASPR